MTAGFSHIGLSTHDMPATVEFYTNVLGFRRAADHLTKVREGGQLRQVYIDIGQDQFLVFMEPKNIDGIPGDYPTGINSALGTPAGMYHISFRVNSLEELENRRNECLAAGVNVSDCIDLGHAMSIFFTDPNDLQLEFCYHTRIFTTSDLYQEDEASLAV
ncbi:MAG: hypothetical protein VR74_05280 [Hyphomonas sp. BRH_c22]|uniref:VOC family protein n=1 Tax=Hyphomonas sp. BRH_c22 TaxID=1629710 RepID=UPI0005F2315D|nr:VOC family protein [Hyphomonas sp. BRH_c22]KJS38582.1 MAG: hypothetical protein VR74_05280 [Hyphomonas sp. BRH_c22]